MRLAHLACRRFGGGGSLVMGLVAVASLAWTRVARASDPVSIYVVPTAVEQSSGSPARVVLHGAFFRLTDATIFKYGEPQCGVMYFECAASEETMCRMQWTDLKARVSATPTTCAGFGSLSVISAATLRAEGAALGTPDRWDLGVGVGTGSYVDGKCAPATLLKCPLGGGPDAGATGSGGAPGTGGARGTGGAGTGGISSSGGAPGTGGMSSSSSGGAPGTGGITSSGGAPGTGGLTVGTTGGTVGSSGGAGQDAGGDAGKGGPVSPTNHRSGCAVGGEPAAAWSLAHLGLVALAGTLLGRRRTRRR